MSKPAFDYSTITVVVQGPVDVTADRDPAKASPLSVTERCLASVREHLPGARLIVSTWKGQPVEELDCDEVVLSDDPGVNLKIVNGSKPRRFNENRQIVSTLAGLERVTTRYAVKMRSDNYLTHDGFIQLFHGWPARNAKLQLFESRIVVANVYAKHFDRGTLVAAHPCDFFQFGLTKDLLTLWRGPLFPATQHFVELDRQRIASTEQELWARVIDRSNLLPNSIRPSHRFDTAVVPQQLREALMANNLVVAEIERIGLGVPDRFHKLKTMSPVFMVGHRRWKQWYNDYCGGNADNAGWRMEHAKIDLLRWLLDGRRRLLVPLWRATSWRKKSGVVMATSGE